jgi:hypothetical protein
MQSARVAVGLLALLLLLPCPPALAQAGRLFAKLKLKDGADALPPGAGEAEVLFLFDTGTPGIFMKREAARLFGLLDANNNEVEALKSPDKICIAGADTKLGTVCVMHADCNTAGKADGICSDMAGVTTSFQIAKLLTVCAKGLKQVDSNGDGSFDMKMDKNDTFVELGKARVFYPKKASPSDLLEGEDLPMKALGLMGLAGLDAKLEVQKTDSGVKFLTSSTPTPPYSATGPLAVVRNTEGDIVRLVVPGVQVGAVAADFVVISGSPFSMISQSLADELGLVPSGTVLLEDEDPVSLLVLTLDGILPSGAPGPLPVVTAPRVELPSIPDGRVFFEDVRFVVNPESGLNILGTDLFHLRDLPTIFDLAGEQVCYGVDSLPPRCPLTARIPGPPAQLEITFNDPESGLAALELIRSDNASTPLPPFPEGTNDPVVITSTKIDQSQPARVEIRAMDLAGNVVLCDPILTLTVREAGRPVRETFSHLPRTEDTLTVLDASPDLHLEVIVNGVRFKLKGAGTLDLSSAMLEGEENLVILSARGKPGTWASILLWDGGV